MATERYMFQDKDEQNRFYLFTNFAVPKRIDKIDTQYVYFLYGRYDNKRILWNRNCYAGYIVVITDEIEGRSSTYFPEEFIDETGSTTGTKNAQILVMGKPIRNYIENIPLKNYKLNAYTNLNVKPTSLISPIQKARVDGQDTIDISKLLPRIPTSGQLISDVIINDY